MRAVLQVVTNADVKIDGQIAGEIQNGLLVLLGIGKNDTAEQIKKLADKIIRLRIFDDEDGKKNLSIRHLGRSMHIVSQFTLYWNCKKGNRPSFDNAMPPHIANELYLDFVYYMKEQGIKVQTGQFGADLIGSLTNDGPVTVVLDTDLL